MKKRNSLKWSSADLPVQEISAGKKKKISIVKELRRTENIEAPKKRKK